ncbi:hypothetical protein [Roseateles subflavus]
MTHHFRIACTGRDLRPGVGQHIDSFQLHGWSLVFHIFADEGTTP